MQCKLDTSSEVINEGCWLGRQRAGHLIQETFLEEVTLELSLAESCISEDKQVF